MTVSFADPFDSTQFSKKYSVILKRLRGYVLTRFFVVPYFCPWKSQEQINIETKGKRLRVLQCDLQMVVYQAFNRNQSCGFHNSENA